MRLFSWLAAGTCCFFLAGCGVEVNENRPLDEIRRESETMSPAKREKAVEAYAEAAGKLQTELDKVKEEYSKVPFSDKLSGQPKARELQSRITALAASIEKLRLRQAIYRGER